jgi:probable phosphoglycerate mutase
MSGVIAEATLVVIRHGETEWNAESRIQGHLDTPLSAVGRDQAQAVAARLQQTPIAAVYASDLKRATQTGQAIALACGHELRLDPRLRERRFGLFEGSTYQEAETNWPGEWALWVRRQPGHAIPGGESTFQVRDRLFACLGDTVVRHAGQSVVVVTHGGVIDILYRLATGVPWEAPRQHRIPNAAINIMTVRSRGADTAGMPGLDIHLQTWADQTHLVLSRDELRG